MPINEAETRAHGAQADTPNSGGTLACLSLGLTAEITPLANGFAFVQLPVYQRVNGLQLEPKWSLPVGVRMKPWTAALASFRESVHRETIF